MDLSGITNALTMQQNPAAQKRVFVGQAGGGGIPATNRAFVGARSGLPGGAPMRPGLPPGLSGGPGDAFRARPDLSAPAPAPAGGDAFRARPDLTAGPIRTGTPTPAGVVTATPPVSTGGNAFRSPLPPQVASPAPVSPMMQAPTPIAPVPAAPVPAPAMPAAPSPLAVQQQLAGAAFRRR